MIDEHHIEDWYRKEVSALEQEPETEVWERLEDSLDVENVWKRLLVSLNKWDRMLWFWRLSYRGLGIALILISGYFGYQYINDERQPLQDGQKLAENIPLKTKENTGTKDTKSKSNSHQKTATFSEHKQTINNNPSAESTGITYLNESKPPSYSKIDEELIKTPSSHQLANVDQKPALALMPLLPARFKTAWRSKVINTANLAKLPVADELQESGLPELFYLGITGSIQNQWLLSPETYNGLGKEGLNYTEPDFGYSAGIAAGCNIFGNFDAEVNLLLSQSGQKYMDFIEGNSIERELNFEYYHVSLAGKWKNGRHTGRQSFSSNWILGIYAGYARSVEEVMNGNIQDISANYRKGNFGMITGYERTYYISNRLIFAPGIIYQLGLVNTFKGTLTTPVTFNRTFHSSIELNIGLRYLFNKE